MSILPGRLLYCKRVKQERAYLQVSRQRQANEYQNAVYEGDAIMESSTSSTVLAISKHQELNAQAPQLVPIQPPQYEA